jgi:hypothetical protein
LEATSASLHHPTQLVHHSPHQPQHRPRKDAETLPHRTALQALQLENKYTRGLHSDHVKFLADTPILTDPLRLPLSTLLRNQQRISISRQRPIPPRRSWRNRSLRTLTPTLPHGSPFRYSKSHRHRRLKRSLQSQCRLIRLLGPRRERIAVS